jgi:hypothetical protein
MRRVVRSKNATGIWALVALTLLAASCGADPGTSAGSGSSSPGATEPAAPPRLPVPVQELEFDATEYSFEIRPDASTGLRPGWTLVRFDNIGVEAHQVMFARVKDGVDTAQLAAAASGDSSGASAIEFVDMIGGVSYIGASHETTALVYLPSGSILAMCYVPDGNGVAHALMGMTSTLNVSVEPEGVTSTAPALGDEQVLGTIELSADGYQIPEDLRTGWYHIENTDSVLHEMSLLRLARSITPEQTQVLVEDLAANATPQVGLEAVGGMGAISAGFDGYLYLDLTPGDYLAVDFMPDPGEPRPHMLDGYHHTFTIPEP